MRLPIRVLATASTLPGTAVSTAEVARAAMPDRDPQELERRIGIATRYFAGPTPPAATLGAQVLAEALSRAGLAPSALRRIIFVSSTGGDFLIPATANALCRELGVEHTCDAFDVNNACVGFLTGFDLAARTVATGLGPVAVVVVETLSRHIAKEEARSYVVLGDAAAAVILGASEAGGVLAAAFGNVGSLLGSVYLGHPGLTGKTEIIEFAASNDEIGRIALLGLRRSTDAVLSQAGLGIDAVDWVVPHQPNGTMLTKIVAELGVAPDRVVPVVREIGSVGAASVAVGLDRLLGTGRVKPGHRILLVGVGAGLAYGALLLEVPA